MQILRVRFRWPLLFIMQVNNRNQFQRCFILFARSGLTIDERDIIETAYRATIIRVIVCTSTLSTGVSRITV